MDLVLIALIPPEPEYSILRDRMEHYSEYVDSKKALHLPPHVTLFPPFLTKHYNKLLEDLRAVCAELKPFDVEFAPLHHFDHRVVLYPVISENIRHVHDVIADTAAPHIEHRFRGRHPRAKLTKRERELMTRYGDVKIKEFYKPHLTLAKSDIDKEKLLALLHNPPLEPTIAYTVERITLLKHQGGRWVADVDLPLAISALQGHAVDGSTGY